MYANPGTPLWINTHNMDQLGNPQEGPGGSNGYWSNAPPTPMTGNGAYRDPASGYQHDAFGGMGGNFSPEIGEDIDDWPLGGGGKSRLYDDYNRTVAAMAQAGIEAGDTAAGFIPFYNAYTAISGRRASGRKASTGERIGAALSLVPAAAWGRAAEWTGEAVGAALKLRGRPKIRLPKAGIDFNPADFDIPGMNSSVKPRPNGPNWGSYAVGLGTGGGGFMSGAWGRTVLALEVRTKQAFAQGLDAPLAAWSIFNIREKESEFAWLLNNADEIHFNFKGLKSHNKITWAEIRWIAKNPQVWPRLYIHYF